MNKNKTKLVTYKRLNNVINFNLQILENKYYFQVHMEHKI